MLYTQVPANTFETLQMNAGIMVDDFTPSTGVIGDILGATNGGLSFNANPEYVDFGADIDNVPANTWQLKRVQRYDPALSGTFANITPKLAKKLSGGSRYGEGDTTHIIPTHKLREADFEDFWVIGDYSAENNGIGKAGYVAIHLMKALNTGGFQWQTTKDGKGQFAFDFHGHYDLNDIDKVPYEIYVKAGVPDDEGELVDLTVTSAAGTAEGDSNITVSGYTLKTGEALKYSTGTTAPLVVYGQTLTNWTTFSSGDDITPTEGHTKITVAAVDADGKAIAAGNATLTINEG